MTKIKTTKIKKKPKLKELSEKKINELLSQIEFEEDGSFLTMPAKLADYILEKCGDGKKTISEIVNRILIEGIEAKQRANKLNSPESYFLSNFRKFRAAAGDMLAKLLRIARKSFI